MIDPEVPFRRLVLLGAIALAIAAVADVLIELPRATAALKDWICGTSGLCSGAYLALWFSSQFPLYAGLTGVAAVLFESVRVGGRYFRSRLAPSVARAEVFRAVVLLAALVAFAELVACAGQATCSLSKSCL